MSKNEEPKLFPLNCTTEPGVRSPTARGLSSLFADESLVGGCSEASESMSYKFQENLETYAYAILRELRKQLENTLFRPYLD